MDRRKFIIATGTAATAVLAGCLGDDNGTDSPEGTFEEIMQASADVDMERFRELMHSESIEDEPEDGEDEQLDDVDMSIETQSTEILEENLSAEELQEQLPTLEDESADIIADQENVLIEGDVEMEATFEGETNTETDTFDFILAKEDGEWLYVGEPGAQTGF